MNKPVVNLPYNVDIGIVAKLLDEIPQIKPDGKNVESLFTEIGEGKNKNRSYSLAMIKFLGLADVDKSKLWPTELGKKLAYASKDGRRTLLAQNLPDVYRTMLKWVRNQQNKQMSSNEIKMMFIDNFGETKSKVIMDRAITAFLNYADYLGMVKFGGKGLAAKCHLTDFGTKILENSPVEEAGVKEDSKEKKSTIPTTLALPEEADFPIQIVTRERTFDWDIKGEADLDVIDSVIKSIKDGWRKKQEAKE
jgi:hypothetical protein